MCGLCKLNTAALDTTVACGYNGIDQHNLGLLPPIAGIDILFFNQQRQCKAIAPIAGIDISPHKLPFVRLPIAPIAGIDTSKSAAIPASSPIAPHCGD